MNIPLSKKIFTLHCLEKFLIPSAVSMAEHSKPKNDDAIVLTGKGEIRITSIEYKGEITTMKSISTSLRDRLK